MTEVTWSGKKNMIVLMQQLVLKTGIRGVIQFSSLMGLPIRGEYL